MRIVIFGANGQTGRLVTRLALDARPHAVAVTRRPDDFPFTDPAADGGRRRRARRRRRSPTSSRRRRRVVDPRRAVQPRADRHLLGRRGQHRHGNARRRACDAWSSSARRAPIPIRTASIRLSPCGSSNRSSPAPSARPPTTISAGWRPSSATAISTGRSCGRPGLFDLPHIDELRCRRSRSGWRRSPRSRPGGLPGRARRRRSGRQDVVDLHHGDTPTMWQMVRREAFSTA